MHDVDLGTAIWGVTKAMSQFRHLSENVRQIVILVVGTHFGAAYEIYAHSAVARVTGMSENQLAMITAGHRPPDLSEEEETAYNVATALLSGGVLPESLYQRAFGRFGQTGVKELIYLVGHYCFVSMTLNGGRSSVGRATIPRRLGLKKGMPAGDPIRSYPPIAMSASLRAVRLKR